VKLKGFDFLSVFHTIGLTYSDFLFNIELEIKKSTHNLRLAPFFCRRRNTKKRSQALTVIGYSMTDHANNKQTDNEVKNNLIF
jgi:hypothetical protein